MKILSIISLGYEGGGAEHAVIILKEPLERKGHQFKILSSDIGTDKDSFFADYTFPQLPTSGIGKYLSRIFSLNSYRALRKVLREYQPDIVHLHTMGQASPSVLFLLRKIPTVMTINGPEEFTRWLLPWYLPATDYRGDDYDLRDLRLVGRLRYFYHRHINGPVYRLGLRNVNSIIAVSQYIGRKLAEEGLASRTLHIGTDLLPYAPARQAHRLLCVCRLEKYKGVEFAIRALPQIIEAYPDTVLDVVGEGPDAERLKALAAELGVADNVEFTGHIPHSQLPRHYHAASIFILPSTVPESFGKVGIEAMSTGAPVIASRIGGIVDWLEDNYNGRLVEPKNVQQIAQSVIDIFSDPLLAARMNVSARETAERFSLEGYTERIESFYSEMLG